MPTPVKARTTRAPRAAPTRPAARNAAATKPSAVEPPAPQSVRATSANKAPARVTGTEIVPGVVISGGALRLDGRAASTTMGITEKSARRLMAAARLVAGAEKNPFAKLSASARASILDDLAPFAVVDRDRSGRASKRGVRARAAAFAFHARMLPEMRGAAEKGAARALADRLVENAQREPHDGLKRTMIASLDAMPAKLFSPAMQEARAALVDELLPKAPPREKFFAGQKNVDPKKGPVLRVRSSIMDEFFRAEVAEYRRRGYQIEMRDKTTAIATKTFQVDGKPVTAQVEIVQSDEQVLDALNDDDLHVVLYSGHANLGGIARFSIEHAPKMKGDKVVGMFACRTKQSLPALQRHAPGAHRIVSRHGTYGHDDRIVTHNLIEGICRGWTYDEIETKSRKEGLWERDNYAFPHAPDTLEHMDWDDDGEVQSSAGRIDVLYDPDPATARKAKSISMKPVSRAPSPDGLPGGNVVDAVEWFNTIQFYWAETFGTRKDQAISDRFRPDSWFKGDPKQIVQIVPGKGDDGKPVYRVKVNAAYAHLDKDALAMLVTFDLGVQTGKMTRPEETEHARRMRALAMVGSYVYHLVEYSDTADLLLRKFALATGFPPGLSWPVVEKSVRADYENDCSEKTIALLERGMGHPFTEVNADRTSVDFRDYVGKALKVLRSSDTAIGRRTFEAIASGRVQIDELSDFTRADFARIRKEFAREKIDLPARDFDKLDDKRTKSMRFLSSSINGWAWDDRIYVVRGLTPEKLASTLAHEVNHVLNRSEEHYRGNQQILVEEYRAFYVEALFAGKKMGKAECKALKEHVIELYTLAPLTADAVPDVPPGIIVPPGTT